MIKIYDKKNCSGCKACINSCPVSAIDFSADDEGFFYPSVNAEVCINCGKCDSVCPYNDAHHGIPSENRTGSVNFYAGQLKNLSELQEVSSGGAFWAFSQSVISSGGVVYGAVQENVDRIYHVRAENFDGIKSIRRSKYLPSNIQDCYVQAEKDLASGKTVLFSGTGCQIAGLNCFLSRRYENLFTCEVVCHGIPSLKIWQCFRTETEQRKNKRITGLVFRDKSKGWSRNQYKITYDDGSTEYESSSLHLFHAGYLSGLFYRPSCGICPFASMPRVADISLADFWQYSGGMRDSDLGVSLVAVNNLQGRKLLDLSSELLNLESVSAEDALKSCRHMNHSPTENPDREAFMSKVFADGYYEAAKKFIVSRASLIKRAKRKIKSMLNTPPRNLSAEEISCIKNYYRIQGKEVLMSKYSFGLILQLIFAGRKSVLVSDSKIIRGIARLRRIERVRLSEIPKIAAGFFALEDAFMLLSAKKVPVYFYNRVGGGGYNYTASEKRRIKNSLSFPVMYKNIPAHEEDLRDIFGSLYSRYYIEALGKIPQVILKGTTYQHEDTASKLINVIGGKRITLYQPREFSRTIHIYGRCGVFGYAVEDKDTLPSLLQKELNERGPGNIRVINHGLWGGDDTLIDQNFLQDSVGMNEGDIVIFYRRHFDSALMEELIKCGVRYKNITEEWHRKRTDNVTFFNQPGHMNAEGYKLAAEIICSDLISSGFECDNVSHSVRPTRSEALNFYLKNIMGNDFQNEIQKYIDSIKSAGTPGVNNGAIVMNCNPFTLGHRGLIEIASRQCDHLYIFAVEEDKSFFAFKDRYEMIYRGTQDLKNVTVIPGGKFIISAYTFPEYFMKDYVKEKNFDVSGDIEIFCKFIAPALNIKMRFAGEEPFDPVTKKYNETMSEILPSYGMRFIEIPRIVLSEGAEVIRATKVRELLAEKNFAELKKYVPDTTYEIIREKY